MALGKRTRGNVYYILVLAAAAFTLVLTSPATPPTEPTPGEIAEDTTPQSTSYCDTAGSSFENGSSSGSPLVADCSELSTQMKTAPNGWWQIQHCIGNCKFWIAKYKTCEFGVSADGAFGLYQLGITKVDVAAILDSSIDKFSWSDKVGASGDMQCNQMNGAGQPSGQQHGMAWAIAHT